MDRILMTETLSDLTAAGLMSDPEAAGSSTGGSMDVKRPDAPSALVVRQ